VAAANGPTMRVTYDAIAHAMYLYFTDSWNGHKVTLPGQVAEFDFDAAGQIIALRVYERDEDGETYFFGDKVKFALQNPNIRYGNESIGIEFAPGQGKATVIWDCNVDLDDDDQIVGVEVLFSPRGELPDRGLDHILKWRLNESS
jgi:uncharacterized protein YuzE